MGFWQEGVRGGHVRMGEEGVGGGYGTPLVLQKPGEEDVAILVTAQVLQRRAGMVWGEGGGYDRDREGFIISKRVRK